MSTSPSELEARPASAAAAPGEVPVFADATDRRRLAMRALGVGVAALAAAWLIALVLGVLGFDALPGVTLPGESQQADGPAPASTTGSARSDDGSRQQVDAVVRSSPASAAAAPARAIAKREARRHHGSRATSRRHTGPNSSSGNSVAPTTQAQSPASSTPASPSVSSAPAPAAQQPAASGNGRGRPDSPGDRRSPTAGTGGNGNTTTTAPAPTVPSDSPGRSGNAPGHTR